jgi:hypothetical protein
MNGFRPAAVIRAAIPFQKTEITGVMLLVP